MIGLRDCPKLSKHARFVKTILLAASKGSCLYWALHWADQLNLSVENQSFSSTSQGLLNFWKKLWDATSYKTQLFLKFICIYAFVYLFYSSPFIAQQILTECIFCSQWVSQIGQPQARCIPSPLIGSCGYGPLSDTAIFWMQGKTHNQNISELEETEGIFTSSDTTFFFFYHWLIFHFGVDKNRSFLHSQQMISLENDHQTSISRGNWKKGIQSLTLKDRYLAVAPQPQKKPNGDDLALWAFNQHSQQLLISGTNISKTQLLLWRHM